MDFDDFVSVHGAYLLRLATVMTADGHQAEDLVQSTLLNAYRHWGKVRAADNQLAYVKRMLVNSHLSWRRRLWTTERPSTIDDSLVGPTPDLADVVVNREAMRLRLAALSPRARTVLVLKYYADMSDQEIGEAMGLTEGTVRSTSSRALRTLRNAETYLEQTR